MHIVTWLILGLVAGFIASKLVNKRGEGFILDIVLGIVGAMLGGFLARDVLHLGTEVNGFNLHSILIAVVGAVIFLVIYHAIRRRV